MYPNAYGQPVGVNNGMYGGVSTEMIRQIAIAGNTNVIPHGTFYFNGNFMMLQSRLDALTPDQINHIAAAVLIVSGNQLKPFNTCCSVCTILWGSILIFPLCFMCCDWWQGCVLPAFEINDAFYISLQRLFDSPNLRTISFTVIDNGFNENKAQILFNFLSKSRVQGFIFINQASPAGINGGGGKSDFAKIMRPIKQLQIISDIRWGNELVI